jgi:hypothetical protein
MLDYPASTQIVGTRRIGRRTSRGLSGRLLMKRLLLSVGLMALATGAYAANETFDVTFSASGFTSEFGQAVPVSPVTGEFQITLDPTMSYTDATAGISFVTPINITLGSALAFTYSPTGITGQSDPGELVVGGLANGAYSILLTNPAADDFWLQIPTFFTTPTYQQLGYSQSAVEGENLFDTHSADLGSVTVTPVIPTGVPELSTWAMMLAGFGALGLLGYSKTRSDNALA